MRSSLRPISPSASPPPASVFSSSFRLLSSEDRRHTLPSRHRRCASEMCDNVLVVRHSRVVCLAIGWPHCGRYCFCSSCGLFFASIPAVALSTDVGTCLMIPLEPLCIPVAAR